MNKIEKKAQKYFEQNKTKKEVYATSDEFLFIQKQDANNHAKTLKDKKVIILEKSKVTVSVADLPVKGSVEIKAKTDDSKEKKN